MAEYINPRVDWAFKRIFGSDDTKECLITFLNGVFEDELVIKDVKHLKQSRHVIKSESEESSSMWRARQVTDGTSSWRCRRRSSDISWIVRSITLPRR